MPETPAVTGPSSDGQKAPMPSDTAKKAAPSSFKIADVGSTTATLHLEDGRVFIARIGDNIDKDELKRGRSVTISSDGMDKTNAPKEAVITRLLPKE